MNNLYHSLINSGTSSKFSFEKIKPLSSFILVLFVLMSFSQGLKAQSIGDLSSTIWKQKPEALSYLTSEDDKIGKSLLDQNIVPSEVLYLNSCKVLVDHIITKINDGTLVNVAIESGYKQFVDEIDSNPLTKGADASHVFHQYLPYLIESLAAPQVDIKPSSN